MTAPRGDRRTRILAALGAAGGSAGPLTVQLCGASVAVVEVSGAAVAVMNDPQRHETVCASDDVAASLVELEFALGEGPSLDAHTTGRWVLEGDLGRLGASRWPAYTDEALARGARAVFAFPLQLGAIRLGALTLYDTDPATFHAERLADALVLARLATQVVLGVQAQAPFGTLHPELAAASPHRIVVHQATGVIAAQLGVGVGEAFARLQGRAYAEARPLGDVAADVVSHRIRFDEPG